MKKVITLMAAVAVLFTFTACTANNTEDGKSKGGVMQDAGNAVNDVLDGAENVVDDVTGNNNGGNNNDNKTHENNPENKVENQTNTNS